MSSDDIDNISNSLNYVYIDDEYIQESNDNPQQQLISYIISQSIEDHIKSLIISLIENDNYHSYLDIYNICVDNNIELPPL
jgi:hypothetical protein